MKHEVSQRYVECIRRLKEEGRIRSFRQFAKSVEYLPQSLSEIMKGRRDVTIDLLYKTIGHYSLNPSYLFKGEGDPFSKSANGDFRVVTLMVDSQGRENIVHVPVPAQAGYASGMDEKTMESELPAYTLPDYQYKGGTFRSFDVSGDSMDPVLENGDKVVCSIVEPLYWKHSIKSGQVYVVVTCDDVLIKRIENKIPIDGTLKLISDNDFFRPYTMDIAEVKEIWHVRTRISSFFHGRSRYSAQQEQISSQRDIINRQTKLIESLENLVRSKNEVPNE
ncbi:MAG: S24 family peptidase [Saprospirales bacterium]|nr:MAG: S24 family peptidase [Saprospirales bacterium]